MNVKRGARRIEILGLALATASFVILMIAPFLGGILIIGIGARRGDIWDWVDSTWLR